MMRAGKDYLAAVPEYEDKRSEHLLELIRAVKAQSGPAKAEEPPPIAVTDAEKAAAKVTNQNKPTLKLTK